MERSGDERRGPGHSERADGGPGEGQSGSGGWDATDDDRDDMTEVVGGEDVPKPDPDKDQG